MVGFVKTQDLIWKDSKKCKHWVAQSKPWLGWELGWQINMKSHAELDCTSSHWNFTWYVLKEMSFISSSSSKLRHRVVRCCQRTFGGEKLLEKWRAGQSLSGGTNAEKKNYKIKACIGQEAKLWGTQLLWPCWAIPCWRGPWCIWFSFTTTFPTLQGGTHACAPWLKKSLCC